MVPPFPSSHRPPRAFDFWRLLLWDGCGGASLSEREQKTQFGSPGYCLYGLKINKNSGDKVYSKEVVALNKCQTAIQFTLIL